MRGYFTFLIVFVSFALLLSLVQLNLNSKTHDQSKAIWTERFYRVQMNVKEVLLEAAREGALDGFNSYCSITPPDKYNEIFAKQVAVNGALGKIADVFHGVSTPEFDRDIDVELTCEDRAVNPLSCSSLITAETARGSTLPCGRKLTSITIRNTDRPRLDITLTSKDGHKKTVEFPIGEKVFYQ